MTIGDMIHQVRIELSDAAKTRWTDDDLVSLAGRAVRRAAQVLFANKVPFARKSVIFTTVSGQAAYAFSTDLSVADLFAPDALYRRDTARRLTHRAADEFERLESPSENANWTADENGLHIAAAPQTAVEMALYYWPLIDTSGYDADTALPWGGRLDDVILEYLALFCKNIDEMNVQTDQMFLTGLEQAVLANASAWGPQNGERKGWV